jgi:glycosyltransferase involved in cell wall biosynthesis
MTASYRTAPCSLIVASRNRAVLLADTIQSVLAGETVPAETIVVDQSDRPEPGLQAMEQQLGGRFVYLWKPGSGVSRARNLGVAAAHYECILFMDDDMMVTITWCSTLFDAVSPTGRK